MEKIVHAGAGDWQGLVARHRGAVRASFDDPAPALGDAFPRGGIGRFEWRVHVVIGGQEEWHLGELFADGAAFSNRKRSFGRTECEWCKPCQR